MMPKGGPDPGHYQHKLVKVEKEHKTPYDMAIEGKSQASTRALTSQGAARTKTQSIFMSTTNRFENLEKSHPNVRVLNPEGKGQDDSHIQNSLMRGDANSLVRAKDRVQYDFRDSRTEWMKKGRSDAYEVYSGKNMGFDQTSPRFNFN